MEPEGSPYSGLLLDMDGTLLYTLEDIRDSVNSVLADRGLGPFGLEGYRRGVGSGVRVLLERLLGDEAGKIDMDALVREVRRRYAAWGNRKTRPYEGIPELLDAVSGAGIPMAIVTNKPQDAAKKCVKELLDIWGFEAVVGAEAGFPLKPDPAGSLHAAAAMGADPGRVLYLGDSGVDMRTARAAGMVPVGALWGFRDRETLIREGAGHLVSEPSEVVDILTG
jgi:phosphoglycolate phosphatase